MWRQVRRIATEVQERLSNRQLESFSNHYRNNGKSIRELPTNGKNDIKEHHETN